MLDIRINFSIDLKKVAVIAATAVIVFSHLMTPPRAEALEMRLVKAAPLERAVTVNLTHLTVTTTKSQARTLLNSKTVKYFDAEAVAFLTVYAKGWSMKQWGCLRNIWQNESHFNPKAFNKDSGAYGIAQFMPSTWGNYNVVKTQAAKKQIQYGIIYIEKRYGDACNAWNFWKRHYWY